MQKSFLFLSFIFLLLNCTTLVKKEIKSEHLSKANKTERIEKKETDGTAYEHPQIEFEFIDFISDIKESKEDDNGISNVTYSVTFNFKYYEPFKVSYKIFDEKNNLLLSREQFSILKDNSIYSVNDFFSDVMTHRILRYHIVSIIDNKEVVIGGEFINKTLPYIEDFNFGPIVSSFNKNKIAISALFYISINNVSQIRWIRFIPPSESYFWDIPYKIYNNQLISKTSLIDKKHPNYFENGTYIIQINFGKEGLIQKEFKLTDLLENNHGKNYGLAAANELLNDKNKIKLEIPQIEKIERMEIELYEDKDKKINKVGLLKFLSPLCELNKKEIINLFLNEYEEPVKIKYNKKYFYKVLLYSKKVNGIEYLSISDLMPLVFPGFSLFN